VVVVVVAVQAEPQMGRRVVPVLLLFVIPDRNAVQAVHILHRAVFLIIHLQVPVHIRHKRKIKNGTFCKS
jgi:hypothetical protein